MIDILIVNYNNAEHLQNLLAALTRDERTVYSRHTGFVITVVDNHSTDGSLALLENQFPEVNVIPRASNDGYSAAVNDGIAATRQEEILLLNSDILLQPETVSALLRIWERLHFPGILAPLHLEPDGYPQLTWGQYPMPHVEAKRRRMDWALTRREPWAKKEIMADCCQSREVDWVSGSCMFFARSTALDIGLWDPNFFLFFEDMDWCLRAREKGYTIYHTAETHVIHHHGASVSTEPELAELEYRRSQCYFTKKYFGFWRLLQIRAYLTGKLMVRWIVGSRSGFDRSGSFQILREIWRNIAD